VSAAIIPDESLQDMVEIAGFGGIAAAAAITRERQVAVVLLLPSSVG